MILTCPDCATRYLTKAEAIGPNGRTVRCASCSATWFVSSEPDVLDLSSQPDAIGKVATQEIAPPEIAAGTSAAAAIRDKADRKKAKRRLFGVGMIWVVTLGILLSAALLAYLFRQQIVDRFPETSTIYKSIGIEVADGGLVFGDVITNSAYIEGVLTVTVQGSVSNPDRNPHIARNVRLSLHDLAGAELANWTVGLEKTRFEAGDKASFVAQYPNPPVDAIKLEWAFTDAPLSEATAEESEVLELMSVGTVPTPTQE